MVIHATGFGQSFLHFSGSYAVHILLSRLPPPGQEQRKTTENRAGDCAEQAASEVLEGGEMGFQWMGKSTIEPMAKIQ